MNDPRIGFAALWDRPREATWSHVPHNLLTAMRPHGQVVDLDLELSSPARLATRSLGARWDGGRPVTLWRTERLTDALVDRRVRAATQHDHIDVVFEIGDLAIPDAPFVCYRDVYWGQIDALVGSSLPTSVLGHPGMSRARLRRRRTREDRLLRAATAVVTFSRWAATYLLDDLGIPAEKVHVVPPGINATVNGEHRRPSGGRRLLFVGRDFERKGGNLLLDAFHIVRRRRPDATLTVAGPSELSRSIPDGVEFVGPLSTSAAASAFAEHDLFVMPSIFEPYGIAFVEALAAGMPCVAPDRCAGSEIVRDGVNGRLVPSDEPQDWADAIVDTLDCSHIFDTTARAAAGVAGVHDWSRVGQDIVRICRDAANRPADTRREPCPTI